MNKPYIYNITSPALSRIPHWWKILLQCALLVSAVTLHAQTVNALFTDLPNGYVYAFATDENYVYVGGDFSLCGTTTRRGIARYNRCTGVLDATWNPNAGGVRTIAISGSDIYIGGYFSTVGGVSRKGIAKLNYTTGAPDGTWNSNANGAVLTIAISGGDIYVGGEFTVIGGQNRNHLAKLNDADGAAVSQWNPNPTSDYQNISPAGVSIIVISGNDIFVGGTFSDIGGQSRANLAKIDNVYGIANNAWNANFEPGYLYTMAVSAGDLYVGGNFSHIGGISRTHIAKLSTSNAGVDLAWNANVTASNSIVTAISISGNDIYVGGIFSAIGGQSRRVLAKLNNTNGNAASDWAVDFGQQYADIRNNSLISNHGQVFAGGNITSPVQNFLPIGDSTVQVTVEKSAPATYCPGAAVSVPFTTICSIAPSNTFTVQLSDSTGSFANPVTIGTMTGSHSGVMTGTIPYTTPPGSGYRIRVNSSNPSTIGPDNCYDITILRGPMPVISGASAISCADQYVKYSVSRVSGRTYQWDVSSHGTIIGTSTSDSVTIRWTYAGAPTIDTLRIRETLTATGCFKDTLFTTTIYPSPVLNAGADVGFCEGSSFVTIGAPATGGTGSLSYSWSPASGIIGASTSPRINVRPMETTNYMVTVTDSKGCQRKDTVTVTVHQKPYIDPGNDTVVCLGEGVVIGNPVTGSNRYTYQWTPVVGLSSASVPQPLASPSVTTNYQVIVSDTNGCMDTGSVVVKVRKITTTNSAPRLDFGTLDVCTASKILTIDVSNTGTEDIQFTKQTSTVAGCIITDSLPIVLVKGAKKTLTVRYTPPGKGVSNGTLSLLGIPCGHEVKIEVKGEKLQLAFTTDKPSIPFGVTAGCTAMKRDSGLTITNQGVDKMTISSAQINAPFSIVSPTFPQDIQSGESLPVVIRYAPQTAGDFSNEMRLSFTAGVCKDVIRIPLSGKHVLPALSVRSAEVAFPNLVGCDAVSDTILVVQNANTIDIEVTKIVVSDPHFSLMTSLPVKLAAGQIRELKLRFEPTGSGTTAATLRMTTNPCAGEQSVLLKGSKQGVSFSVPDTIDLGELVGCAQATITKTFTLKNTSGGGLTGNISAITVSSLFTTTVIRGDSLPNGVGRSYSVTFQPDATLPDGVQYGKMDVTFMPCSVSKSIILKATKATPSLQADAAVDYGQVPVGTVLSKLVKIYNSGTSDVTVSSLSGLLPPLSQGIVNPPLPAILHPNDTLSVEVLFTVQKGKFTDTLTAEATQPCSLKISTIITAEGTDKIITQLTGFNKDIGNVPITKTKQDVVQVTNDGTIDMTLTDAAFMVGSNQAFSVQAGQFPIVITAGQTHQIAVNFSPVLVGSVQGVLLITGDKDTASSVVRGTGIDSVQSLSSLIATGVLRFDSVCMGQSKVLQATLKNTDITSMQLLRAEWVTNIGNTFSSDFTPQVLLPDASVSVSVNCSPASVGELMGQVRWVAAQDTAYSSVTAIGNMCSGVQDTARLTIAIQDISAQVAEKVNLVLKVQKQSGMQLTGAPTQWYARVRYNKSILYNEETKNACVGIDDSCVLELTGTSNAQSDELISIPCVVTLGTTDISTISIDEFRWTNSGIITKVETQNGKITLSGICDEGGVRLYILGEHAMSLATRPNPTKNSMEIHYSLREPLMIKLELLNTMGQVVRTIINKQNQAVGQHSITCDMSAIGNGVYILRLVTDIETLTTRVDVEK
ncbi:MAG: choice-of-anchor D domain-containing protein [Ignavibacteria bacterium]|nr:choice-of-anchor D domain-containing protein [Ignavibacteria bacterium]